jgi:hypothetical protein
VTTLQIPTPNLKASIAFYKDLNFETASINEQHYVYDEQLQIEINPNHFIRPGIKMYREQWKGCLEKLKELVELTPLESGYLASSPSGCWVYLMDRPSPTLNLNTPNKTILGNYAGVSLESCAFQKSIEFWHILGFKTTAGSINDPWILLSNEENFKISIMKPNMCPHLFFNPSLSFFNGKENEKIISSIRQKNISIAQEITHFNDKGIVDNIILRDPSGLGFFIFND